MTSIVRPLGLAFFAAALIALGCTSTSSAPPAVPAPAPDTQAAGPMPPDANTSSSQVSEAPALAPIYFDTDEAALKHQARGALKQYAEAILAHPEWGVVAIEGHCDERGGDTYNLALGKRRATAVESQLVELGVPPTRLATRSYGARKPAMRGHDEAAWRQNRRSELRVADTLASF
jgi:peptidoglycan-associated lipoprotein